MRKIFLFSILFLSGLYFPAGIFQAADATAASCSRTDVQTAATQVQSSGGGTVNIPAGDCDWTGTAPSAPSGLVVQ